MSGVRRMRLVVMSVALVLGASSMLAAQGGAAAAAGTTASFSIPIGGGGEERSLVGEPMGGTTFVAGAAGSASGAVAPRTALLGGKRVTVEAQLDKVRMYIGDVATLAVIARSPEGVELGTSAAGPLLSAAGLEVRDFEPPAVAREGDERVETRSFTFSTFTTGAYLIPPIPVELSAAGGRRLTLATPPLRLEVVPVPRRPGEPDDIRDIKAPLALPAPALWPWAAGLAAALAAAAAFLVWLRRRGVGAEETTMTPLDAYEDAVRKLAELRRARDEGRVDAKAYAYGFAELLRLYLERRWRTTTLSETTPELLLSLGSQQFPVDERAVVQALLEGCDLVKFARWVPPATEVAERDSAFDAFLVRTRPAPEPTARPGEEAVVEPPEAAGRGAGA